jgi:hypothetical protein
MGYLTKGYCSKHYTRYLKYGDPLHLEASEPERHGMRNSAEYSSWYAMKRRCYDKGQYRYVDYGGRGISVCDRWRKSFLAFYGDMGPLPFSGAQIDRINNDGNYELGNCRWVSSLENNRNRRSSKTTGKDIKEIRMLGMEGKLLHREIAKRFNLSRGYVSAVIAGKKYPDDQPR